MVLTSPSVLVSHTVTLYKYPHHKRSNFPLLPFLRWSSGWRTRLLCLGSTVLNPGVVMGFEFSQWRLAWEEEIELSTNFIAMEAGALKNNQILLWPLYYRDGSYFMYFTCFYLNFLLSEIQVFWYSIWKKINNWSQIFKLISQIID